MIRKSLRLVLILASFLCPGLAVQARSLSVCIGDEDFAPYSFLEHEAPGQYLVRNALERRHDKPVYTIAPWRRCIEGLRTQTFDAVIGVAANESFYSFLSLPMREGKADPQRSLGGAAFMVVRWRGSPVDWDGEQFSHLREPINYPSGIIVVRERLAKLGVPSTDVVKTPAQMMRMLVLHRIDAAIVRRAETEIQLERPEFQGKLEMLSRPLIAWDGYLAIRRPLCDTEPDYCQAIWDEIGRIKSARGWAKTSEQLLRGQ